MQSFFGKSVYKGIVVGPVVVLGKSDSQVRRKKIEDTDLEIKRVEQAGEQAREQLQKLYDKAVKEVGRQVPQFLKCIR